MEDFPQESRKDFSKKNIDEIHTLLFYRKTSEGTAGEISDEVHR